MDPRILELEKNFWRNKFCPKICISSTNFSTKKWIRTCYNITNNIWHRSAYILWHLDPLPSNSCVNRRQHKAVAREQLCGHAVSPATREHALSPCRGYITWTSSSTTCYVYQYCDVVCVTIDGVSIGENIYLPLIHTTRNYKQLQRHRWSPHFTNHDSTR
jgi:hypothetical protein